MAETTPAVDARLEASALFEEHGVALYRFASAVLHGPDEAEDVVQETFVRLLRHLRGHGARSNLRAWLFTVAANACRDVLRRRRRWLQWAPEHDRALAPEEGEGSDRRRVLLLASRRLPARDRLLLALRAQGASYRAIACGTGIREQSVGRLLARATTRWQRECQRLMVNHHEHLFDESRAPTVGRR